MLLHFYKYQATGNDFIVIDDRDRQFDPNNHTLVRNLCNRRFGIGADGLILLRNEPGYHFRMIYFNADGYEGSMCGNGGRCITAFAYLLNPGREDFSFLAWDGLHTAGMVTATEQGHIVRLQMQQVSRPEQLGPDMVLHTGSPHYVRFVEDIAGTAIVAEGKAVRYSERFLQEGINVNFVETGPGYITVRTYERGVEDETFSCGTGVTASAIAAYASGRLKETTVEVHTPGGRLSVSFEPDGDGFREVYLTGEAVKVFEGDIRVP